MKTDPRTGAPQFTVRDLNALGETIHDSDNPRGNIRTWMVDLDSLNMWLRAHAIRKGKHGKTKRKNSRSRA
jgi:hypothetical protein